MIVFARNTPPKVANWLRAQLAVLPNDPILQALATDDRMADLWAEVGEWPGAECLVGLAVYFSAPTILSALQKTPRQRISGPEYLLGCTAEDLARWLEWWADTATELLGEPVDELVERLHAFAIAAFKKAEAQRGFFDDIPPPNPRGRGTRKQLAFRNALARALQRWSETPPLPGRRPSTEQQDSIVATITSVVFPQHPVDAETIRRHRQRQRGGRRVGDKSRSE
jgi:hypothetical protein